MAISNVLIFFTSKPARSLKKIVKKTPMKTPAPKIDLHALAQRFIAHGKTNWADLVRVGPCVTVPSISVPAVAPPPCDLGRFCWEVRRKEEIAERQQFRSLAIAIAKRHAIVKNPRKDRWIKIVKERRQRKLLLEKRKRQRLARRPKEVDSFGKRCRRAPLEEVLPRESGWGKGWRVHEWKVSSSRKAAPTSKPQVKKQRAPIPDDWRQLRPDNILSGKYGSPTEEKCKGFPFLARVCSKTLAARHLFAGLLKAKAILADRLDWCDEALAYLTPLGIEPQMDPEGPEGSLANQESQASNTIIDQIQPLDVGPSHVPNKGFQNLSISREIQSYPTMYNRWMKIANLTWDTSTQLDKEMLNDIYIPEKVIKQNLNSPSIQLLLNHRWFRGNMRVRFILNSNAFQVGMLIGSVLYTQPDADITLWDNVYCALQRNHCKVNAGSSNDAELVVPFKWFDSLMSTQSGGKMAKLSLRVLNPLAVAGSVATSCSITIMATFEDMELFGMISRSLGVKNIQPQMDVVASISSLADLGNKVIRTLGKDRNRDKPPEPSQPPFLVPTGISSFAYMDYAPDPVQMLRADPIGQTPHTLSQDEMNPLELCQGWGLRKTIMWSKSKASGHALWDSPVMPVNLRQKYPGIGDTNAKKCVPTPLSYVSSFYGFFRGDIEYKLEVVASKFHSGRLIIGSIPAYTDDNITLEDLQYSAYKIVDLADSTEIVFRAPWQWKNSFAINREGYTINEIPSKVFILVVNPLITIENVPDTVYVNVYERASDNFELAIPKPSVWDPCLADPLVPPAGEYLIPYNLENRWYTTSSKDLNTSTGKSLTTIYIQNVVNGWVGYTGERKYAVYKLSDRTQKNKKQFICNMQYSYPENNVWKTVISKVRYGVYDPGLSTANAHGLVVFPESRGLEMAKQFITALKQYPPEKARDYAGYVYVQDGPWSTIDGKEATNNGDLPLWELVDNAEDLDYEVVEPQMDTSTAANVTSLDIPSKPSGGGLAVFGESSPDLKSLCRRYNHLCSIKTKIVVSTNPRDSPYLAKFPVTPFRVIKPNTSYSYDNRYRHGTITSLAMMYRFWRGSIRYRFVVVGSPPEGSVLYVTHMFNENIGLKDFLVMGPPKVRSRYDMMNTQYATASQVLSVNPSLTIEVPYYQNREFSSVFPDVTPSRNGVLYVWMHGQNPVDVHIEVYYSLGDDGRFSTFQGIPMSMDISEINVEPQMDDIPQIEPNGISEALGFKSAADSIETAAEVVAASTSKASEELSETLKSVNNVTSRLDKILSAFQSTKDSLTTKAESVFDVLCSLTGGLFTYISDIVYVLINPSITTIAWALFNLYYKLFKFTMKGIEIITNFVKTIWASFPSKQPQGDSDEQIESNNSDPICDYANLLFVSIAMMCKVKTNPPTSWKGVSDGLFNFSNAARGGHYVSKFFSDNIELLKRIYRKFLERFGLKVNDSFQLLSGVEDTRLKNWILESSVVTSSQYDQNVKSDPAWSEKVFELAVVGRSLQIVLSSAEANNSRLLSLVNENMKALKKLEKFLVDSKIYSGVRYEPFCLWIAGDAGTGKTRYLQSLANDYAATTKYSGQSTYCTITAGQKFMDSFVGQPTVLIDDFLATSYSADPDSYHQFLQMKSSALYNPPFAMAEEKGKMVNFSNLFISSNSSHFDNMSGIHEYDAYNRRRELVLLFKFRNPSTTADNLRDRYTVEQLEALEHIEVYFYTSPTDRQSLYEKIPIVEGVPYSDTVKDFILNRMNAYHQRETENYKINCKKALQRIDNCSRGDNSLANQIEIITKEFQKYESDTEKTGGVSGYFKHWLKASKDASTFLNLVQEDVEPNSDNEVLPKFVSLLGNSLIPCIQPLSSIKKDGKTIISPVRPIMGGSFSEMEAKCPHELFDFDDMFYDAQLEAYTRLSSILNIRDAYCVPHGCCVVCDEDGSFRRAKNCTWEAKKLTFYTKIFYNKNDRNYSPPMLETCKITGDWSPLEEKYHKDIIEFFKTKKTENHLVDYCKVLAHKVDLLQGVINKEYTIVNQIALPRHPRTGTQKSWGVLRQLFSGIYSAISCLASLFILIRSFRLFTGATPVPNLHPSGDFKTFKQTQKTVRARAMKLCEGNGPEEVFDRDLVKSCSGLQQQHQGILNKIIYNTFTLLGYKDLGDNNVIKFNTRCLGLYNRKFLVLKHYIEHFRAQGADKVAVIFHGATTLKKYNLSDFDFRWTKQGYGISELPPSIPRQFKNILKFIPRESFDGNYPTKCKMVEVDVDKVCEYPIDVKKLVTPRTVPSTATQSGWKIEQGLEYKWAGKGKCGSFVFAESMACPLIAIHTAGIGESVGFGEILLRETFEEEDVNVIEYVTPQMSCEDSVFGLDGEYEQVGQLDPDLVPRISLKTKIIPSLIHGVFPVKTEPAPLSNNDVRLAENANILKIGVSKRCNPLLEFMRGDVNSAYLDYYKRTLRIVKPARAEIKPLTPIEACEGFKIEGYDSMEFKTSEGHPWVKMRPQGYSDKSWLFQLSNYEDGRIKVEGINVDLYRLLEVKQEMRERGLVPPSYFTTCLKDARISLEKISKPGSTRVFEMSPVELTIAQRQYYLDFTVAYRQARLEMEHSIGINPDGQEWSDLVNWLTSFSDMILTADYSGYGPRVAHSLLERAFDTSIIWLAENEECSDEEAESRQLIREVIKHEVTHGLHIAKDLVFRPSCGLPSGNCETVERNSQTNSLYIRIAFLGLARKFAPTYTNLFWFDKKVRLVTNGDDLIAAVKPDIISWFNNKTLIEFFAEYGLKMTDALKSGEIREYCSIEEATYLKRGFKPHPFREGQWLAPLLEDSITDTANWIWRSVDDRAASLVNSEMSCRLAYTQGPEFYLRVCRKIQQAWEDLGVNFEYPPWELLDNHVWEDAEGPTFHYF